MPAGAPRTVSLSPDEMIELGKEMVKWVSLNNPLHLSQWYSFQKKFTKKQWRAMILCDEFLTYYEEALQLVGLNYIKKNSDVEPSIKQRWQRVYFDDLRMSEDEDLDAVAERSKKIAAIQHQSTIEIHASQALTDGSNVRAAIISTADNKGLK